ncbi:hypothetical protein D9756_009825 [Leucocoprinus leucothites]|uniref:Uncharacterized protein n=1 Tax=Leucocoprinus leucothites TaxID=201217 RepID=A0A8H5CYG2_9AGAR|nr:hypothetical protein D9756_009825 [Leucoagaricus leucothites]
MGICVRGRVALQNLWKGRKEKKLKALELEEFAAKETYPVRETCKLPSENLPPTKRIRDDSPEPISAPELSTSIPSVMSLAITSDITIQIQLAAAAHGLLVQSHYT